MAGGIQLVLTKNDEPYGGAALGVRIANESMDSDFLHQWSITQQENIYLLLFNSMLYYL